MVIPNAVSSWLMRTSADDVGELAISWPKNTSRSNRTMSQENAKRIIQEVARLIGEAKVMARMCTAG